MYANVHTGSRGGCRNLDQPITRFSAPEIKCGRVKDGCAARFPVEFLDAVVPLRDEVSIGVARQPGGLEQQPTSHAGNPCGGGINGITVGWAPLQFSYLVCAGPLLWELLEPSIAVARDLLAGGLFECDVA